MSNLNELLPELKRQSAIVVTGPQRSGTTIAAHILAQELGYTYVDENDFGIYDPARATQFLRNGRVVLQSPGLMYCAHQLPACIVVMRRPLAEIAASEKRVGWRESYGGAGYQMETALYNRNYGFSGQDIAWTKYLCWDMFQKARCDNWFDLDYQSLRDHPLWVEQRKDFTARQWR